MKHVYKILILLAVFTGALVFMSKNIKMVQFEFDKTVSMGQATFPVMELKTGRYNINLLHGFSGNLDANKIRETITPIDNNKMLEVFITEKKLEVRKLKYEIRTTSDNELLDTGTISALTEGEKEETRNRKSAKIKIKADLNQGKEYGIKITLVTKEGRKIHYYSRIKYYGEDSFLEEKMDFVMDFHTKVLDKEKAKKLTNYLEPNPSMDNTSLALVNIHSSFDNFSWGNIKPKVISKIIPTIKEFNIETAAIELTYFVTADAGSAKEELYQIKEFFRVRYTKDRMYLLNYQRTMEAQFDIDLVSMAKSEIKLGITSDSQSPLMTSSNFDRVAFVRGGSLWYYSMAENKIIKVFSFQEEETDNFEWDYYDQHNIRILKMDDSGNMDFMVYGYMNRGDYEGRVAILLYKFYAEERRIEEQVYIPLETTYQMLKEDLNDFSYVNEKGIFYFTMNNVIYAYNIIAKRLDTVAAGINEENFVIPKEGNYIAWQNSNTPNESKKITLLNLETEKETVIEAPQGDNIRVFGSIYDKIIYGFVHTKDITETTDGTIIVPAYHLEIADQESQVIKEYEVDKIYITDIEIRNNIIELKQVTKKKSGNKTNFKETKSDQIINRANEEQQEIYYSTRVTELAMTEVYITLPSGFEMAKKPTVKHTVNTVITEDTTLRLTNEELSAEKYYVSALGGILTSFTNPAEAIIMADENMGVVINQENQIIWERGGRYNRKTIDDIEPIYVKKGMNSVEACIKMVIRYKKGSAASMENVSGKSIYQELKENLRYQPINLTGCTLDEVLYYISSGRPVIAMKDGKDAVLLVSYDEYYVGMIDPSEKKTKTMSIQKAGTLFEEAGNLFISYME